MGTVMPHALEILLALQVVQASVGGTVRDENTGAPLAGVTVALTDLNRITSTDADGRYVLRQVPTGAQHISVRLLGHAPRTLHALVQPDAEDWGKVIAVGQSVTVPYGSFSGCITIEDWVGLDLDDPRGHKTYCPQIGHVRETKVGSTELVELISRTP